MATGPAPVQQVASITAASTTLGPYLTSWEGFGSFCFHVISSGWTGGVIGLWCGLEATFANAFPLAFFSAGVGPNVSAALTTITAAGVYEAFNPTGKNIWIASSAAAWTGTAILYIAYNSIS